MREERIVVGETREVEGIDSDTRIVSNIGEGDGEIEIMMESAKIGEGREKEEGSGEEMKGRKARIVEEECGKVTTGSSAWLLLNSGILRSSSPLACIFNWLCLFLVVRRSLLIERLIL